MKKKILIVGIGGVGGYYGGRLAHYFQRQESTDVYFMVRGKNLTAIRQKGLQITQNSHEFQAYPDLASDNPEDFGKMDYIMLCTKSYDIEETLRSLTSCVKKETIFLPLLNGVDSVEKIKTLYPKNTVAHGCVYIISRLTEPGHIQTISKKPKLFFGIPNTANPRLDFLNTAFKNAGITAILTPKITTKVWEKFLFISVMATATSYYDKTFGEIQAHKDYAQGLRLLITESVAVAQAQNIPLPEAIKEKIWNRFLHLAPQATTSMHADYRSKKGKSEVQSLTGYMVKEAHRLHIKVPTYQKMFEQLTTNRKEE